MREKGSFIHLLGLGIMAKLFIDTAGQMFNPFLAVIAGGAGIGIVAMGRIVALSKFVGILAPSIGHLADRFGYRMILRLCLVMAGLGLIFSVLTENILIFTLSLALSGIGIASFTPTLHAYMSTMLSYKKRAKGIATLEYSFALAGIFGLSLTGVLIEHISWKAPFFFMGAGLLFCSFTFLTFPVVDRTVLQDGKAHKDKKSISKRLFDFFDLGKHRRSAWGAILLSGLSCFSMLHIIMVFGVWLQQDFGLGPIELGKVALLLGIFDLVSCIAVAMFSDRIGKWKSVFYGVCGTVIAYGIFPFMAGSLVSSILVLVLIRISFEFTIVSNFSLLSEQVPSQRGKIMGLGAASGMLGTGLAGITGPVALLKYGVWGLGPFSLAVGLVTLLLMLFVIEDYHLEAAAKVLEP